MKKLLSAVIISMCLLAPQVDAQNSQKTINFLLVANSSIPAGQELNDTNMKWVAWPMPAIPRTAIVRAQCPDAIRLLTGYRAAKNIDANEILQPSIVTPAGFKCQ